MTNHREAFEKIVKIAKSELGGSLKKMVLYGSVADNKENEESDLDIFAVVETREEKKWLERNATAKGVDYGVLVSIIVKTEEEFKGIEETSFIREVMETGETYV